ncbi:S49 family peptidase [Natribaculum luteum]|uniref:S49 family peptidase n=1 Tax=Natribaculum luteum TaxID=1586232 RepID=A0ABD5P0Y7_9EURY|nr:S49 family peptidase [Natribaculum luteum]
MSSTLATLRNLLGAVAKSYVTVVIVALLVGASMAPVVWGMTSNPDGTVAVIEVDSSLSESSAERITDDLREARQNDSIDAVVLEVDSPGGGVSASEGLYLAVERTAEEMPVVTSVESTAASGAYYMIAPSDEIYVKPGSIVGSIGVRATYLDVPPTDQEITTGPDKNGGGTEDEYEAQVEMMRQAFVGTVTEHRGDELTLSETELAYAKVYTGIESVENGLADDVGDTEVAVGAAADEAGLEDYDVVEMESEPLSGLSVIIGGESGDRQVASGVHPQTFGQYGAVNTPTFLALWGSVDDERVVASTALERSVANETGGDRP